MNTKQIEALIEIANEVASHGDCHCEGDGEPCIFCFANSILDEIEIEDFKRVASWMTGDSGDSELASLVKESLGARICLCKSQGTCWHCRARAALDKIQ